ncbi:DUF488 domain-containing protein [Mesorhizobium sp. BAC0120]|uniref:DUF488 domain-containing protein n=1 Tax=Mesorhizobium sp. BAC0120 TaxID=3090670 RepID=UPI00298D53CE|nr:DUF488 domain-containing protein [Mesorhizobium sp. BAC0120]MDW6021182.1 DUF488 domain-containing protein [Mesorhizobium sp. BAC0120]
MRIRLKRIYEPKQDDDGFRILVDRLWPRGLDKQEAGVDLWLKDVAPSAELRRWFGHDPNKWSEFQRRYSEELQRNEPAVTALRQRVNAEDKVTLLYAAKDTDHNNAIVLRDVLQG